MSKNNVLSMASQYQKPIEINLPSLDSVIDVLSTIDVDVNGQIVKQIKYVSDDSSHRYDGLKASDFELANQIAAGVQLVPVKLTMSSFDAVGYAVHQIEKIADFNNRIKQSNS